MRVHVLFLVQCLNLIYQECIHAVCMYLNLHYLSYKSFFFFGGGGVFIATVIAEVQIIRVTADIGLSFTTTQLHVFNDKHKLKMFSFFI